ncbi:MAG: zinc-ribbon domain-containing protein [Desulfuromonadales bacterium]
MSSTIKITCPNCNFSRDVPSEKLPQKAVNVNCPQCKKPFVYEPKTEVQDFTFDQVAQPAPPPNDAKTKPCPFCKELIHPEANKCKHCGSTIDNNAPNAPLQSEHNVVNRQINNNTTPQQSLVQSKFSLFPNERLIFDGVMTYKKSMLENYNCTCYLTDLRLVVCDGGLGFKFFLLLGPMMHLIALLFKLKKISFQIPIADITNLQKGKHGLADKLTFNTKDGKEYTLLLGSKKEQWMSSLRNVTGINF